jgi:hypothetical protein
MKTELETYRFLIEQTRSMAVSVLKRMDEAQVDPYKIFEVDGKPLNSVYWQLGHMAWAQNNLILRCSGGPNPEVKWLKHFGIGKLHNESQGIIDFAEARAGFDKVHQVALQHLEQSAPEIVDQDAAFELFPGTGIKPIRFMFMHHIRHEGTHVGQLFLLAKMYGVKGI